MSEEEEEITHEEYVEDKLEGTEDKLNMILIVLGIIAFELFLLLFAITRLFPGVWKI